MCILCRMLTVTATYKGKHYEATEIGSRVVIHAPDYVFWTQWRRGRLVRSQALAATAPARVVSRLEERLRRAGQRKAVAGGELALLAGLPDTASREEAVAVLGRRALNAERIPRPQYGPHDGMRVLRGPELDQALQQARNARAEERLSWARDRAIGNQTIDQMRAYLGLSQRPATRVTPQDRYRPERLAAPAITPAEDQRGWAAWARFLQLPETASHEEILEAMDRPATLELPMAGAFVIPAGSGPHDSLPPGRVEQGADAPGATPLADIQAVMARIREGQQREREAFVAHVRDVRHRFARGEISAEIANEAVTIEVPLDTRRWARLVGLPETASRAEIIEHLTLDSVSDVDNPRYSWRFVTYDTWQPPITQGSPAYMQSLVAQITPETARLWADAWGCEPDALAERVLEPGQGDLVDSDTARELSRRILADVGQPAVDGARRADRSVYDRHTDPDTVEDLEYYGDAPEPLEDVEWLRGVLAETERSDT